MRKIDSFYSKNEDRNIKSEFYLGRISRVLPNYCVFQNENMTLLGYRGNYGEELISNTINYLVLIDDVRGVILGRVEEISLNDSDSIHDAIMKEDNDALHPSIKIEILGVYSEERKKFEFSGLITAGIGDKVYAVTSNTKRQFFESLGFNEESEDRLEFGEVIDSQGKYQSFSISATDLFDHHLLITGATNSGKSSSALAILDQLHKKKGKFLIIDPTGEYENSFGDKDTESFVLGKNLFFSSGKLSNEDWRNLFNTNNNTQPYELNRAIQFLKYQQFKKNKESDNEENDSNSLIFKIIGESENECEKRIKEMKEQLSEYKNKKKIENTSFDIKHLPEQLKEGASSVSRSSKKVYERDSFKYGNVLYLIEKIEYSLKKLKLAQFFKKEDKEIDEVLEDYIKNDRRCLYIGAKSEELGIFLVNYISRYLLRNHTSANASLILFVDEAHKYLMQEDTPTELISIAREGRKQGIFLFLSTQSPSDLPPILLSQIGMLLLHRLTGVKELEAIKNFASRKVLSQITRLKQGEAILTGVNIIAPVDLQVQKSSRTHKNKTPRIINR